MTRLSKQNIISEERKKLGQELHDVVIQNLFATGLQLENIIESAEKDDHKKELSVIKESLNHTIDQVRGFIKKVSSKSDTIEGLQIRIKEMIENYESITGVSINLNFEISDIIVKDVSPIKLTQIYYIVQEAVSNAIKHSEASKVDITLTPRTRNIHVIIKDNGKGFDEQKIVSETSYGLVTMKERSISINSKLAIISDNKGTEVHLSVPRGVS